MRFGLMCRRLACVAVFCFAAGVATAAPKHAYKYIVLDGSRLKWGSPMAGSAAVVTYAVVSMRHQFREARNCPDIVPPDRLLEASRLSRGDFDQAVGSAFAAWSAVASIVFVPADEEKADILVGAQGQPRGRAFTNVDYGDDVPSPEGLRTLQKAVICLNPARPWKIGFDGDLEVYDLEYSLTHEIGHAIGLDHPDAKGQLMDFRYGEAFRTIQPGDIDGVAKLYGPAPPNAIVVDSPNTSRAIPSMALGDRPRVEARPRD